MTALLVEEYREPPDCPYVWGDGYVSCAWHDLPVHRCLIQGGHDNPCVCMCGDVPASPLPHPTVWQWVGYLDECVAMYPSTVSQPCVKHNPTRQHMCIDGATSVHLGHTPHDERWHTCRCGERWLTHAAYRADRDARWPYETEVT